MFTTKPFKHGDFLLQYKGALVNGMEGERKEASYSEKLGSFMYFFQWNGKTHWYVFLSPDQKKYLIRNIS